MSENKDTMADDAIEWLNEIRCWINRCKDTEWGDDDQRIVDFITAALQSPRVPVIDGLDNIIQYGRTWYGVAGTIDPVAVPIKDFDILMRCSRAYAELQKRV